MSRNCPPPCEVYILKERHSFSVWVRKTQPDYKYYPPPTDEMIENAEKRCRCKECKKNQRLRKKAAFDRARLEALPNFRRTSSIGWFEKFYNWIGKKFF